MKQEIELYPVQYKFFTCPDKYTGFIAGVGSGKTFVGSLKALAKSQPGTLGMVCAPTYKMLRDSTLRTFMDIAGKSLSYHSKSEMLSRVRGGGEILWRSSDDPDKLRGPNLHWAWIDEGGLSHPETWKIIIGRLRADGKFGECWTTSTPKGKRNWLYEQSDSMTMFKATTLDNPYVSQEWKDSLLTTYTGKFLAQEIYADFVSFEGLIYDFDKSVHAIKRNTNEFVRVGFGIDVGYTNPAAILKIYEDMDGRFHVAEEWYKTGKLQSDIIDQAKEMSKDVSHSGFIVDVAAPSLIASMRNEGMKAIGKSQRVMDGIVTVQELLKVQGDGKPRLTVDPSCVNLINEFESYVWKEGRDEPVKEFDHALDALRYYVHGGGTNINPRASIQNYAGQSRSTEKRPPF